MARVWQLQEAKNKLSEVIERALREGPQVISRRGKETAVVLSVEEYSRRRGPKSSLSEFFLTSPLRGTKLHLERDNDAGRGVDLDVPD
jgi:prevent-host-death family protein